MNSNEDTSLPRRQRKEAADASLELMKQLITLASGILVLSATFATKLPLDSQLAVGLVAAAWLALVVAVISALNHISAIVQSRLAPENDWSTGAGRRAARFAKVSFVIGLSIVAVLALVSLELGPRQTASVAPSIVNFVQSK